MQVFYFLITLCRNISHVIIFCYCAQAELLRMRSSKTLLFSVISNTGKVCNEPLISGDCQLFHNCTTCVQAAGCSWCDGVCAANKTCDVTSLAHCPYNQCLATDCAQCYQLPGCEWNDSKYPRCDEGRLKFEDFS